VAAIENRVGIVYAIVIVVCLFSPFILNDVVVIVLTPVVVRYARQFDVDPAPLLVAEITLVNVASSLTPLGNPQNILLWTASGASFEQFVSGTWLPLLASALIASLLLLPLAMRAGGAREFPTPIGSITPATYLILVALTALFSDLAGLPPYAALGLGFLLGFPFTFRSIRQVSREFDLRSLLTLYVFVGSITVLSVFVKPLLTDYVQPVASGAQPYSALFIGVSSNVVSNVPTTQLVLSTAHVSASVAPKVAVEAGLAGNIGPVGSFANLLALQMTRRAGLPIRRAMLLQFLVGVLTFLPAFM
jgi:Na+/H+ antiporter NhaD/arsenite permease-like protein